MNWNIRYDEMWLLNYSTKPTDVIVEILNITKPTDEVAENTQHNQPMWLTKCVIICKKVAHVAHKLNKLTA